MDWRKLKAAKIFNSKTQEYCDICSSYGAVKQINDADISSINYGFAFLNFNFRSIHNKRVCFICLQFLSDVSRYTENFVSILFTFDRISNLCLDLSHHVRASVPTGQCPNGVKCTGLQRTVLIQKTNVTTRGYANKSNMLYMKSEKLLEYVSNRNAGRTEQCKWRCNNTAAVYESKPAQCFTNITSSSEESKVKFCRSKSENFLLWHPYAKFQSSNTSYSAPFFGPPTDHNGLHSCPICKNSYKQKHTLKIHLRVHTDERPYKCTICNKKFKQISHLKVHHLTHADKRAYQCNICNKFFSENNFRQHLIVHTSDKPFRCTICDKRFKRKFRLKDHLDIHIANRLHKCTVCSKSFCRMSNLVNHLLRIHSDESQSEICPICNKSFRLKAHLSAHLRRHTDSKSYKCNICSKSFKLESYLKIHLSAHTNKKPYKCTICSKSFAAKSNIKGHLVTHIPDLIKSLKKKSLEDDSKCVISAEQRNVRSEAMKRMWAEKKKKSRKF